MGKVRDKAKARDGKDRDRSKHRAEERKQVGEREQVGERKQVGEPDGVGEVVPRPGARTRNEVVLVGRVGGAAEQRTLPSGDELVVWRVVVDRPPASRPAREGARAVLVDTIDCTAWEQAVRRVAGELGAGDLVALEGSLRRRFWRSAQGPSSRYEVEVTALRRLTPPTE